jgi:hypothetical protein
MSVLTTSSRRFSRRLLIDSSLPGLALIAMLVLSVGIGSVVLAQGGPPPADATPGAPGAALGGIDASVAPGYRLVMAETVFAPGSYVTQHTHPTAIVVCVQSGALGFAIQAGAATITRAETRATPTAVEQLAVNTEVVLAPGDCVAFDHFAQHTAHTAWNAADGTTVIWEARLVKADEPFTTFVDAEGTPVPAP